MLRGPRLYYWGRQRLGNDVAMYVGVTGLQNLLDKWKVPRSHSCECQDAGFHFNIIL